MNRLPTLGLVVIVAAAAGAGGYWWAQRTVVPMPSATGSAHGDDRNHDESTAAPPTAGERPVLYWYDPMYPAQHFDKPGKSPFMDMALVPRYAEADDAAGTVRIDPAIAQNLGMRVAEVETGRLPNRIDAVGSIQYNGRNVSVVQARTAGYVERVFARAPGDVIAAGAPLAELLVPEWSGAQTEFLSLLKHGDAQLIAAARQRLRLLGMPAASIAALERSRKPRPTFTISAPIGGVIDTLEIREGMTVAAGQTLVTIKGIDSVWLEVAVPEAQGSQIRTGDVVEASLAAYAGETLRGNVIAVLPVANNDSRTIALRVQLDNPDGRLRPGMFATVTLSGSEQLQRLLVPSEALIRTGRRTLVMRVEADNRYRPVEVTVGREVDGRAEVLGGLDNGDRVVISGQFLIDSEASLTGVMAREGTTPTPTVMLHQADATVVGISADRIELDHEAFATLGMPAMQMQYRLAAPDVARGVKVGQRVRVSVQQTDQGPIVARIEPIGMQP